MDKLRLTTVTPSKKKKHNIHFKSKVKKLFVENKITKNDEFFARGTFKKTGKGPEMKVLSDVTKLLLQSVENEEAPVSADKGDVAAQLGTGKLTEIPSSFTTKDQRKGHSVCKSEKLKDNTLSKAEKQNEKVAKIKNSVGKETELPTVANSETTIVGASEVTSEAGGQKCFKLGEVSDNLANPEVPMVKGSSKKEKRRRKRKRKDSNADSVPAGEGKGSINKEQRKSEGTMLGGKNDSGQGFQVSDLSPHKSDKHGKGRQESGSFLYDSRNGTTNGTNSVKKRRKSGKKSDTGQDFQVSDLSSHKSEMLGKGTSDTRQESDNFLSGKGNTNNMKSNKEQRRSGGTVLERKSDTRQGFQVSDLSSSNGKDGRQDSDNLLSDKGALNKMKSKKEQRRSGRKSDTGQGFQVSNLSEVKPQLHQKGTPGGRSDSESYVLGRKSETGQGFQVSDLSCNKSKIPGKETSGGRRDSDSFLSDKGVTNDIKNNKENRKSGKTLLGRKSDTGQGFEVSDLSSDKLEMQERQDSSSSKEALNYIKNNREHRRSGRKSDVGILQGFQVSDLSPDKSRGTNISSTSGSSKDAKVQQKWKTSDINSSDVFDKATVKSKLDKPDSENLSNSDNQNEDDESEIQSELETWSELQVLNSIRRVSELLDATPTMSIKQNMKKEEQNWSEKNTLNSMKSIDVEEGSDSTSEPESTAGKVELDLPINTQTLDSYWGTRKVLEKWGTDDWLKAVKEPVEEESDEVWKLDSNGTNSEESNSEHEENNSSFVRKETPLTLSIETVRTPDLMSDRLKNIQFQEEQEQSSVYLENFLNFKSSRPSEHVVVEPEDKLSLQFYRLPDNRYVLLLKQDSVIHFRGKLMLTVLAGGVEVLGCVLRRSEGGHEQSGVPVFSPRGSSLLALEVSASDESEDGKEVAVEAASSVGMQRRDIRKIEAKYEEGDCLLLLEATTSVLYAYLSQQLPGQLFPTVETTEVQPSVYCVKELQCTFYMPNFKENVKVFVKNEEWEPIVQQVLDQNQVDCPASCTMVCGGKGVGKSTLLRYLINRALSTHSKVLCLDFDPGQAEFTVPGCLSAVLVNQPLLGPNYTHLTVPEKSVYLGHVNVSQCPTLYLEAVDYIVSFCRENPEFLGIPWFVNTMGFCKGLGVELTKTVIHMVRPTDLVQIQSQSKQRNFPNELRPLLLEKYRSPFRYVIRPQGTVDYQFHLVSSSAESKLSGQEAGWGFEARKLRDIVVLSYLGQLVKPPTYSLMEIVPYMTSLSNLKLRICHELVSPNNVLSVLNGCMVALCYTDSEVFLRPSEPDLPCVFQQTPVCDCLGFGVVRGVDMEDKKLFLVTPVPADQLGRVNCLVMGVVQLPASVLLNPVGAVGHIPYVTLGPGQPTGRSLHRSFSQLLLTGAV